MRSSLSFRLLLAAALSTCVALIATGLVLNFLFRGYFEGRVQQELDSFLVQLTANVSLSPEGLVEVSELSDPRFEEPLSGFYWQVQLEDDPPIPSQSFWADPLTIPRPVRRGEIAFSSVRDDDGEEYLTGSWIVTLSRNGTEADLFMIIALDQSHLEQSISGFSRNVMISLGLLGTFLVLASWFQVRVGLRPLEKMRAEVNKVKERRDHQLSSDYPTEVKPLIDEVNDLLDQQKATIGQARARASNLAHGLKTPLTILRALSEDLRGTDQSGIGAEIDAQVDNMKYFVERELAKSRDQITDNARCNVAPVAENLVQAFKRTSSRADLRWIINIGQDVICPFDEYALTELLGNLIDNASKWAAAEIKVTAQGTRSAGFIEVADDGPGIPQSETDFVLQRGTRLEVSVPGQGLGLTIVNDMIQQRGMSLELLPRKGLGLAAKVSWNEMGSAPAGA